MKKIYLVIALIISTFGLKVQSQAVDLFFSEYCEGSGNNKYVEIFNGTGISVNLANYQIGKISNGGSWNETTFTLSGTLASNQVYILYHSSLDSISGIDNINSNQKMASSIANWNGNDALALQKNIGGNWVNIDVIGISGPAPSNGWDVAGTTEATKNHTLIRKPGIASGDTLWTTVAGTDTVNSQYDVYATNYFTNLGTHVFNGNATPSADTVPPVAMSATAINLSTIEIVYNEKVDTSAVDTSNYTGIGMISTAVLNNITNTVTLSLVSPLTNASNHTLTINGIADTAGNTMSIAANFTLYLDTIPVIIIIPTYTISDIVGTNSNGEADSINVECRLRGVLLGINLSSSGFQFTLNDGTEGIGLYTSIYPSTTTTFVEGNEVFVIGTIEQYNGLTQLSVDSIRMITTAGLIPVATPVILLNEDTESELVQMQNMHLVDATQWPTTAGMAVNVEVSDGVFTFTIRIDDNCPLQGTVAPTGNFIIVGIGGQYDSSIPYTSGYQLFPRYISDVITFGINEWENSNLMVYPNPASNFVYIQNISEKNIQIEIFDINGKLTYKEQCNSANNKINISELQAGVYMVRITNENNLIMIQKLIVR